MVKTVDIAKFRKGITKSIPGISTGFNDPKIWLDTGSYALNFLISGKFDKGIPLEGKMSQFAGSSGSGKSYLASANLVKDAQKQNVFPIIIDSENALDEKWLQALGVDTSEEKLLMVRMSMIDEVAKFLSEFIKDYKDTYKDLDRDERPPILIIIDSLGMMLTPTNIKQFEAGDMKGDMGIKAKQITALVRNTVSLMASERIGMVVTNHTYSSQDMFSPESVITGGCLVADTIIQTEIGLKSIQNIKEDDKIITMFGTQKVLKTFEFDDKNLLEIDLGDEKIKCSEDHRFLVKKEDNMIWVKAKDLSENDELIQIQ